jgi:uncharacterized glyoxalase superfamily protein PhnB
MKATRIFPVFQVRDLAEALHYYCAVLGFTEAWKFGSPAHRAGVALGEIEIQLDGSGLGAMTGTSTAYCHMTGIDEHYAACRARGAKLVRELAERPWGVRDFQVEDPSGNKIGFAELL